MERVEQMPPNWEEADPPIPPGYRARERAKVAKTEWIATAVRKIDGVLLAEDLKRVAESVRTLDHESLLDEKTRMNLSLSLCKKHQIPRTFSLEVNTLVRMASVLADAPDCAPNAHRMLVDGFLAKASNQFRLAPELLANPWIAMLEKAEQWHDVGSKKHGANMPDCLVVARGILLSPNGLVDQRWLASHCSTYHSFYLMYLSKEYSFRRKARTTHFFKPTFRFMLNSSTRRIVHVEFRDPIIQHLTPEIKERFLRATAPAAE